MKTPEAREKDAICKYLKEIGAWYFRPYMAGRGPTGVPDIIACIDGTFWGIEVKSGWGKLTTRQIMCLGEIRSHGGRTAVGTCRDVIETLERYSGQS